MKQWEYLLSNYYVQEDILNNTCCFLSYSFRFQWRICTFKRNIIMRLKYSWAARFSSSSFFFAKMSNLLMKTQNLTMFLVNMEIVGIKPDSSNISQAQLILRRRIEKPSVHN